MNVLVQIDDKVQMLALGKAQTDHNASLRRQRPGGGGPRFRVAELPPVEDHADYCATDEDYVAWVVSKVISDAVDKYELDAAKLDANVQIVAERYASVQANVAAQKAAIAEATK